MNLKTKKAILMLAVPMVLSFASVALALATGETGGTLFDQASKLISDIQSGILTLTTPAAVIGVAVGALTMKFAGGGDDSNQKRSMGKKAISTSIVAWALVNGVMLILNTLSPYLKG